MHLDITLNSTELAGISKETKYDQIYFRVNLWLLQSVLTHFRHEEFGLTFKKNYYFCIYIVLFVSFNKLINYSFLVLY